ncbi:MAG TPA: AbrB/MazE/SpoVT family DNA-binding domain-containing protein [Arachnia sp.]|nr:AbrB/MazE/SpoVT family DNA-binding domain-containing protein [Arachnia sp.]HMT86911.1 AbrB/MazE/SpoVT family DNA-binding domain-containing protein [Arachnia sp.]
MRTTIDSGGRVVIPKEYRDALQLTPGQSVDIAMLDGRISIDVTGVGMHLEMPDGVPVAVPDEPIEPLTSDAVRSVIERLRR